MQKMLNRLQLMIDANTLGVTVRNLAAMVNPDAEVARKVRMIQTRVMQRYGCRDIVATQLRIAMLLRQSRD
jgi:hypothetical protein